MVTDYGGIEDTFSGVNIQVLTDEEDVPPPSCDATFVVCTQYRSYDFTEYRYVIDDVTSYYVLLFRCLISIWKLSIRLDSFFFLFCFHCLSMDNNNNNNNNNNRSLIF